MKGDELQKDQGLLPPRHKWRYHLERNGSLFLAPLQSRASEILPRARGRPLEHHALHFPCKGTDLIWNRVQGISSQREFWKTMEISVISSIRVNNLTCRLTS